MKVYTVCMLKHIIKGLFSVNGEIEILFHTLTSYFDASDGEAPDFRH